MIAFRRMEPRDLMFVVSGWSSSYRTSHSAGFIQMEDWATVMHAQIVKALARPDVVTTVAYETDDPDPMADLYGFITADIVARPALVYYVYVKEQHRKSSIARRLFRAAGVDPNHPFWYACKTAIVSTLERKIPLAKYRPLHGRFPKRADDGRPEITVKRSQR